MLESNTETKQATGTSSKLGQAGRGQTKGSEVPSCPSWLTCMRHAPEPQPPSHELGTVAQVRRGRMVRQEEQGPSPTPPLSPSLFNKTAHHLRVHRWGSQRLRFSAGRWRLSRLEVGTSQGKNGDPRGVGQQPVKGEVAQERPPSQPGGGQQQLVHCSQ